MNRKILLIDYDDVISLNRDFYDKELRKYFPLASTSFVEEKVRKYDKVIIELDYQIKRLDSIISSYDLRELELIKSMEQGYSSIDDLNKLLLEHKKLLKQKTDLEFKKSQIELYKDDLKLNIFDRKDQILEEIYPQFKDKIDYYKGVTGFIPKGRIEEVNDLYYSDSFKKIAICSHYNCSKERKIKEEFIKDNFTNIDFIPVLFHEEEYSYGKSRVLTPKSIASLKFYNGRYLLQDFVLIDDSKRNCISFIKDINLDGRIMHGGKSIQFGVELEDLSYNKVLEKVKSK